MFRLSFYELLPVIARPPAVWTPRPAEQRVAEASIALMERALEAGTVGVSAEVQVRQLLKVSGQMLLRVDALSGNPADIDPDGDGRANSLADKVRERLGKPMPRTGMSSWPTSSPKSVPASKPKPRGCLEGAHRLHQRYVRLPTRIGLARLAPARFRADALVLARQPQRS